MNDVNLTQFTSELNRVSGTHYDFWSPIELLFYVYLLDTFDWFTTITLSANSSDVSDPLKCYSCRTTYSEHQISVNDTVGSGKWVSQSNKHPALISRL